MSKISPNTRYATSLGAWLRQLRNDRDLPLRIVADAAGMDLAHLQKIELGQRLPTEAQARKLAEFFRIEETDFLARRIVERFKQEFAGHPAAEDAISMLAEEAGFYRVTHDRSTELRHKRQGGQ